MPAGNISAMNTPNARSRFLLLPQLDEASTRGKAPGVLRRYSLTGQVKIVPSGDNITAVMVRWTQ